MENDNTLNETRFEGFLKGHADMVTSIVTGNAVNADSEDAILVSGSRDKTLIIWNLGSKNETLRHYGEAKRSLTGHNHFVTDLAMSKCNSFVLSSSWDKTLRLWDIRNSVCKERFVGHDKEVHTICFSESNRQIFSGSSENTMRIWNNLGECKVVCEANNHQHWVTRIRYSPSIKNPYYASTGRDGRLKIWSGIFKLYASIKAHDSAINALALSTTGQFLATGGGTDNSVKVWNYGDLRTPHIEFKNDTQVNDLAFNSRFQWLAVALDGGFRIVDVSSKDVNLDAGETTRVELLDEEAMTEEMGKRPKGPRCTSITWSSNGQNLYIGCSDGVIRVYSVTATN